MASGRPARRRPFTVLVVERDPTTLRLLRFLLVSSGYIVLEARTGAEAADVIADSAYRINLLLVDAELPEISREALAYRVRWEAPEALIVYMSPLTEEERARAGLGDVEVVQKPLGGGALVRRIRELLGDDRP